LINFHLLWAVLAGGACAATPGAVSGKSGVMNREKFLIAGAFSTFLAAVFLAAAVRPDKTQAGPIWTAQPAAQAAGAGARVSATTLARQYRGIWLQVHNDDSRCPFEDYVREIAATGANAVCLAVAAEQENGSSNVLYLDRNKSPSDERLTGLIRLGRSLGKRVVLMPIVLLSRPAADEWRGKINPDDWDLWWKQYEDYLLHYATLAQENGVSMFMVGSELISTEKQESRWRDLIAHVRRAGQDVLDAQFRQHLRQLYPNYRAADFARLGIDKIDTFAYSAPRSEPPPAELVKLYDRFAAEHRMLLSYSANWDHYTVPKWWDALDAVGMTSYYDMNPSKDANPSVESMVQQWEHIRAAVQEWQASVGKPIIFTEVGCPSQNGCSTYPWNYYNDPNNPNMLEQQKFVDSFLRVFAHENWVGGVLIWKWRDHPQNLGGPRDTGYTPYRKPVMETLQAFFASPDATSPAAAAAAQAMQLPAAPASPAAMKPAEGEPKAGS
jgi:hypothetical protein